MSERCHIALGDAVEWAERHDGEPFHALLCDPPYEMGFMGKDWDASGVPFLPATWQAFGTVMHHGAFGMAFASARGWHRMACAIEDAGFIIHPSVFGWVYASGFPKATNPAKAIDKAAGAPVKEGRGFNVAGGDFDAVGTYGMAHEPVTDLAKAWNGHRYGLQALKPALEPIIVFQKPYAGRPIDCITSTGAGALNIDGGRIGTGGDCRRNSKGGENGLCGTGTFRIRERYATEMPANEGRWPANFVCDETTAPMLDEQSGTLAGGARPSRRNVSIFGQGGRTSDAERVPFDSGGASRYFFQSVAEALDYAPPVHYCPKASRSEREAGLNDLPDQTRNRVNPGGLENDPRWAPVTRKNTHPTVKPIALCRWLATLLLPPDIYSPRRLFIPFAGSGSECIGALTAGWDFVQGVELTEEYLPIARGRIDHALRAPVTAQSVLPF